MPLSMARLLRVMAGPLREIRRAVRDAPVQHARTFFLPAMPISTGTTSHRAAAAAIRQTLVVRRREVFRHGARHALIRLAHTLRHHAVIRAEHQRRAPLTSMAIFHARSAPPRSRSSSPARPARRAASASRAQCACAAARAASSGANDPGDRLFFSSVSGSCSDSWL